MAHQLRRQWQSAVDDFTRAMTLDPGDAMDILPRRAACNRELGRLAESRRDLDEHARLSRSSTAIGGM